MRNFCLPIAFSFAVLSVCVVLAAENPGATEYRRVHLAVHPNWISSAVYVPALRKVLVVDPAMNRLFLFDEDGQATVLADPAVAQEAKLPALVAPTPNGFILKLVGPEILEFDGQLHLRGGPKSFAANDRPTVGSICQWAVTGRSFVAYGSIRSPRLPDGFELGFLRASLGADSRAEMLQRFDNNSYYLVGYQYVAAIGRTAYFLRMDEEASLFKVPPGATQPVQQPDAIPPDFRSLPQLHARMDGPADAPALFAEIERLAIPAGLYGGPDGFLYLLTRQPSTTAGATDWWLHRLDPEGGKVLAKGQLPTHAKHLTVVPAPESWICFEKGEVDGIGHQPIESMIVVPISRLMKSSSAETKLGAAPRR